MELPKLIPLKISREFQGKIKFHAQIGNLVV